MTPARAGPALLVSCFSSCLADILVPWDAGDTPPTPTHPFTRMAARAGHPLSSACCSCCRMRQWGGLTAFRRRSRVLRYPISCSFSPLFPSSCAMSLFCQVLVALATLCCDTWSSSCGRSMMSLQVAPGATVTVPLDHPVGVSLSSRVRSIVAIVSCRQALAMLRGGAPTVGGAGCGGDLFAFGW